MISIGFSSQDARSLAVTPELENGRWVGSILFHPDAAAFRKNHTSGHFF
jgi:hypothetical protein